MGINLGVPDDIEPQMKPRITVIGVGGAGGNAVNNMIEAGLEGVDFVVANTDAQALAQARTDRRIQLGSETTHGLGSGARPDIGRAAAEESYDAISTEMKGSHMCFITAGMGGGTGTGAAPVVARCARDMGILTVGVVTKPFQFEGMHRMRLAEGGIEELAQYVDTLIIIPNQNLFRVANEKTTFADAFKMADNVLYAGVRSVTDLMIMPGLINLDFADVRTVMMDMGRAMMGTGEANGENRAIEAAEAAIANPLLEETSMRGARGVLINITGGNDLTLYELDEAANRIREEIKCEDANVIFGSCLDATLEGTMRVSVVASGIDAGAQARPRDESDAAGSGFGLGLAAAGKVAGGAAAGADRMRRPAAVTGGRGHHDAAAEAPAAAAAAGPGQDGSGSAAVSGTATPGSEDDGLLDPSQVLEQPAAAVASTTTEGAHDTAAPAPTLAAAQRGAGYGGRPGATQTPHGPVSGATGRAFIPPRPVQPPATSVASRLDGPGDRAAGSGQGADPRLASGHAEAVAPVRGQTALDRRYQNHDEGAAEGARPALRPAPQPGLRVAAESPAPAARSGPGRDHGAGREEDRRDRPSLFQRMTGFGRVRSGEEDRDPHPGAGRRDPYGPGTAGSGTSAASRDGGGRRDAGAGSPRAMAVNPEDRPSPSHSEDQLEIPAFLRRQAN